MKDIRELIGKKVKEVTAHDWLLLVLFVLVTYVIYKLNREDPTKLLETFVLWFTAYAILRYTRETWALRMTSQDQLSESQRQTRLSLLPVITLNAPENPNGYFEIKNYGEGTAFSIKIEDYRIKHKDEKIIFKFTPFTDQLAGHDGSNVDAEHVVNGEVEQRQYDGYGNCQNNYSWIYFSKKQVPVNKKHHFKISFLDAVGTRYRSTVELTKSGSRIIDLPTSY